MDEGLDAAGNPPSIQGLACACHDLYGECEVCRGLEGTACADRGSGFQEADPQQAQRGLLHAKGR